MNDDRLWLRTTHNRVKEGKDFIQEYKGDVEGLDICDKFVIHMLLPEEPRSLEQLVKEMNKYEEDFREESNCPPDKWALQIVKKSLERLESIGFCKSFLKSGVKCE